MKSHVAILIGASGSRTAESANTRNRLPDPLSRKAGSGNEINFRLAVQKGREKQRNGGMAE